MKHKPGFHINKAIFLDRDGVINKVILKNGKPHPPQTMDQFELLPQVEDALKNLKNASFKLVIVTNQPDVTNGIQTMAQVDEMHNHLLKTLPIDLIKVCFHIDKDGCQCRKPKPGMLLQAAKELGIDLSLSFMIGDRWRDIDAGLTAGCKTFWIKNEYDEKHPDNSHHTVNSLWECSEKILKDK